MPSWRRMNSLSLLRFDPISRIPGYYGVQTKHFQSAGLPPGTLVSFGSARKRRPYVTTIQHPASEDPIRNERFRLGIEGSGIGVWDLDLVTHQLLWSNTTRALFGVPDDLPLTYELFLSLLDPAERERTEQAVARSIETGCGFDVQYRVNGRSKSRQWVRARGSIVEGEPGEPVHLSGIVIDIDDQKQVEEALRTREGHLHSILETIPDAMIVIDGNGI